MMKVIKKFGIVALVLTALTGMIPITANAAGDNGSALQILTPVEGAGYWHVPGNVLHNFEVTITDAIGELNDGTYTVWWDNNGSGNFVAVSGLKADAKGTLIVPRKYVTAMTYNSQFYVVNEGGMRSEVRHITVQVDAPRTITGTADKGTANYQEGDTASVTFNFSDTFQESTSPGYIFLVPLDEATSNHVEITTQSAENHTTSVIVFPGMAAANSPAKIKLKDGYHGATLNFGIELRDSNDNTRNNVITVWEGRPFSIGVDNVMPSVSYISMNDTPVKVDGGSFTAKVPAGVQKTFTIGIKDPALEIDFADGDKAYTHIKFWENGSVVDTRIIKGVPIGKSVTHTFMNAGNAQVTAKVRDKDMTDEEFASAPEFTVNLTVVDPPAVVLTPYLGSNIFTEQDTGIVNGRINVELTVPPSGLASGETITVALDVSRNGINDGALPVLNKYEVTFGNGQTSGYFFLRELDGTAQSELKGFRIRAYVKERTVCPADPTKTWRQFYQPVEDFDIFVTNVAPRIGPGEATSTNQRPAALNVPFTITWNVRDVPADQESMKVTWFYNGSSQTTTQSTTGTYLKEIMFDSLGSKVVTLTVEDKDGGTDMRSWYYRVEGPEGETEDQRESEEKDGYTWTYTVVNGEAIIYNYGFVAVSPDPVGQLTIPSELGECPVGGIAFNAFERCTNLTAVTFPANLKSIGESAFSGCSGLTSVALPSSVTNIGYSAFSYCSGLTSVTIPEGVTSIGSYAFENCYGLTSVALPSSVTNIGIGAFSGLMSFEVDEDNPAYCSLNGLLCSKDGKEVILGMNGDVTIPSSVTSVGNRAFYGCSGLTSVTIPSAVTNIGYYAFYGCSGLTSVTIPSAVTNIGDSAFYGCSGLTSLAIPSGVTSIGYYAFDHCERLTTVYVEKGDVARVRGLLEGSLSRLDLDSILFVEDWVRVDETVILPSAVIEEGMAKYPALAAQAGGDVEAFAKLPSAAGKLDRSGRQMQVWQDLVAGTDPTDPDDLFKVTSIAMENGELKVTWSPDLNENGTKNVRRYIQYGSKAIGESAAWVDISTVPAAEQNDYKFRKVTVGLP